MNIIVGLGNPGDKYQKTRHNVGFMFLDFLVGSEADWKIDKKFKSLIFHNGNNIFVKPQTYMNNSGWAVKSVLDYYKLIPKKFGLFSNKNSDLSSVLTVVHDDLDIDFGKYKISINSGSAGHNGVRSTISHLKTQNFRRLRLGINNEFKKNSSGENFVLQNFSKDELDNLNNIFSSINL